MIGVTLNKKNGPRYGGLGKGGDNLIEKRPKIFGNFTYIIQSNPGVKP